MEDAGFRLVERYSELPVRARSKLDSVIGVDWFKFLVSGVEGELERKKLVFKGVLSGDELLGVVVFRPYKGAASSGKICRIGIIWVNPIKRSVEFRRTFGVSPVQYLFEELVRKGYSHFRARRLTENGLRMLNRLKSNGLIEGRVKSFFSWVKIKEQGHKTANLRSLRIK